MASFADMCLFDKDWTGFSAEEYREASESVMREKQSNTVEVRKRLDLTGYEVVRAQYFCNLAESGDDDFKRKAAV